MLFAWISEETGPLLRFHSFLRHRWLKRLGMQLKQVYFFLSSLSSSFRAPVFIFALRPWEKWDWNSLSFYFMKHISVQIHRLKNRLIFHPQEVNQSDDNLLRSKRHSRQPSVVCATNPFPPSCCVTTRLGGSEPWQDNIPNARNDLDYKPIRLEKVAVIGGGLGEWGVSFVTCCRHEVVHHRFVRRAAGADAIGSELLHCASTGHIRPLTTERWREARGRADGPKTPERLMMTGVKENKIAGLKRGGKACLAEGEFECDLMNGSRLQWF